MVILIMLTLVIWNNLRNIVTRWKRTISTKTSEIFEISEVFVLRLSSPASGRGIGGGNKNTMSALRASPNT